MEVLDGKTKDIVSDNLEKLKQLFPEVFTENKIMWDRLQQILGGYIETEQERYEFNWNGKSQAIQLAQKQTTSTLRPCKDYGMNWESADNIYIEGDNLEVLRLLQNSYWGKVKLIFIDPPYNTGNDFIYPDNFVDNIKSYKNIFEENLKSNTESLGRFHTNWLNMMYPRLKMAKNFLMPDGVICVCIDNNEVANLKKIMDELYGEENFITMVIWNHTKQSKNDEPYFSKHYNSILFYRRSSELKTISMNRTEADNKAYSNPDNDVKGDWRSGDVRSPSLRPSLKFNITTPSGKEILPPANGWRWSQESINEKINSGEIIFNEDETKIIRKIYLSDQEGRTPENIFTAEKYGTTREATNELKNLFDGISPFDTPKPTKLIKEIMKMVCRNEDIILDFFSGSASTAHAVMSLNQELKLNNKFIMVQIPEKISSNKNAYEMGYRTICDIGIARIKKVANSLKEIDEEYNFGLKVFKIDESNFKKWNENPSDIEYSLLDAQNPIRDGRTESDVVYEILLKYGIELTVPIQQKNIAGRNIFSIAYGYMIICLELNLTLEEIEEIAKEQPTRIVFYDDSFKDDVVRTNADHILKRYNIKDIRVI